MAKIILNGNELEAPEGAPLVEVIKNSGQFISNLCYVDGLPPYAGCRTCVVEIEGMPGTQLSCTTKVRDEMIVNTETPVIRSMRQAVLSLIMSYHSDRCLTCHRIVKCKPGDTCLRDDVVTHRCLTCSKNYRCELQTTCEMLEMAGYEPWDGDGRTYYNLPQPTPDQANPFLEFDPQMCIICTRCVRACDEIRHTGALTLAGRGFSTRIEFGAGGPVHDSNCDFCGACIDVCPTATLMEHPNKWGATQTERWTPTTCTQCSVGCSISLGTKRGRGVIVRPDMEANPVSRDQLCVRGRFHYDAIKPSARLTTPLIKRNAQTGAHPGGGQDEATWEEAIEFTVARLAQVREAHGAQSVGFLGSPLSTNEENYLLSKLARAVAGTNNVDSSAGPMVSAACGALRAAFGSEVLPADLKRVAGSRTLLVVATDLESSHNVACLRAKDAVVRSGAKLIVVSPVRGELNDFAEVWVQAPAGQEHAVAAALAAAVEKATGKGDSEAPAVPESIRAEFEKAVALLAQTVEAEEARPLSILYALPHFGAAQAATVAAALANIAIACAGDQAPQALFILPQEANAWGMRDTGVDPALLPGYRATSDGTARQDMERLWGAPLPQETGLDFEKMLVDGKIKALVVMDDNPLMLAPNRAAVRRMLESLEFLAVIDSVPTDTAALAHAVLPAAGHWSKEGTSVSADRRVLRLHQASALRGEAQQGWRILAQLATALAERTQPGEIRTSYANAAEIMAEMAEVIPLYKNAGYREMDAGTQQPLDGLGPKKAERQQVAAQAIETATNGHFSLIASRSLYMSYEGAAIHHAEADKLHRDDCVRLHPEDAAALGVTDGDAVTLRNGSGELTAPVQLSAAVPRRAAHIALYYDGGAPATLFDADAPVALVEAARAAPAPTSS